jgi:hypothetical protein
MSYLTACQPGWLAVFENVNGGGYSTEPVACWLLREDGRASDPLVHPMCALGSEVCDATKAANYLGVVGPGIKPDALVEAARASRAKQSA